MLKGTVRFGNKILSVYAKDNIFLDLSWIHNEIDNLLTEPTTTYR